MSLETNTTAYALLEEILGERVVAGADISPDFAHDESLVVPPSTPGFVVYPKNAEEVSAIFGVAAATETPVTPRGMGTGLGGGATPEPGAIVVSLQKMNAILEIDTRTNVAVVQPGVTLQELDAALAAEGLLYPVYPGELSASIGGNIATNAGGMRAVKYGVTRDNVLGLEAVLPNGDIITCGGRMVKTSSGYDLTQLIVGSEGTLAIVTEATLKLVPRPAFTATLLVPFDDLGAVVDAVPPIVGSGLEPAMLEYVDALGMAAVTYTAGLELGISDETKQRSEAFLVIELNGTTRERLDEDVEQLGALLGELGAIDVFVLDGGAATKLVNAREQAFWTAKNAGIHEVLDVVVPRSQIHEFMSRTRDLAAQYEALVPGAGHAGDGNIHLAVLQQDVVKRERLVTDILRLGVELGGAISAEHGIGRAKKRDFALLEDPAKLILMRGIKRAFDPKGILNPGVIFDPPGSSRISEESR